MSVNTYQYHFQVVNQTSAITLTLYSNPPWDPIGVSGYPGDNSTPLPSTIGPGQTGNFAAVGHGAYVTYNVTGPSGTYPQLRIRWVGQSTSQPLPGGPTGQWQSTAPTTIHYDEVDRLTDHILYLKDGAPSKVKRGVAMEDPVGFRRVEMEFRRRQVEDKINERREASGSVQEKREARPLGRSGRV